MLRKQEFIDAHHEYDYKIDAIEQFLDQEEQRNHDYAVKYLTPMVEDAGKLDFNDYKPEEFEHDTIILKNKAEELNDTIDKAQRQYFEEHHRKEFDENIKAIWALDDYKFMGFLGGHPEHLKQIAENDPRVKTNAETLVKIHKQWAKDDKAIRAQFSEQLKKVKAERETLKERKANIKKQKEQNKAFAKKYGDHAFDFDLKKVAEGKIEEVAWAYAKLQRTWIRMEIYRRTEEYVGKLVTMDCIDWGNNGTLNGIVTGEKGDRAAVQTIIAGGYNIQCWHYRVLVKPLR